MTMAVVPIAVAAQEGNRKMKKTQILLYCLETLLTSNRIAKEDLTDMARFSKSTFTRYIQELRAYFADFHPGTELLYDKKEGVYVLTNFPI